MYRRVDRFGGAGALAVSSRTGIAIALGGIGILVLGIYLMTICTPLGIFGICVPTYGGAGMLLILLGIVVMVVGFVLPSATAPSPPQYYSPVGYGAVPYGYPNYGAPAYGGAPYGAQPYTGQGQGAPAYGPPPYGAQPYPSQPQGALPYGPAPYGAQPYGAAPPSPPYPQGAQARTCVRCGAAITTQVCGNCGTAQW
jgi:hypothetical protein